MPCYQKFVKIKNDSFKKLNKAYLTLNKPYLVNMCLIGLNKAYLTINKAYLAFENWHFKLFLPGPLKF
jgi:hypothetical protein